MDPPSASSATPPPPPAATPAAPSSNPLFQMHHPTTTSSSGSTRPYPIRAMSSSATHSPFFQTRRASTSISQSSQSQSQAQVYGTSPGSTTMAQAILIRESGAGGEGNNGHGYGGNSPDSVGSSTSKNSAARFGVIGTQSQGSPTLAHNSTSLQAGGGGSSIPPNSNNNSNNGGGRYGYGNAPGNPPSGLRNTLARGSMGAYESDLQLQQQHGSISNLDLNLGLGSQSRSQSQSNTGYNSTAGTGPTSTATTTTALHTGSSTLGGSGGSFRGHTNHNFRGYYDSYTGRGGGGVGGGGGGGLPGTRSSSFSGIGFGNQDAVRGRDLRLVDEMPSHIEESWLDKYKSSSSPFPTFSDTSSPPTSPPLSHARPDLIDRRESTAQDQGLYERDPRPHSPPRAEANVSRSRSQSMAPGVLRPQFAQHGFGNGLFGGFGLNGFTGMESAGPGRGFGEVGSGGSPWADSGRRGLVNEPSSASPFGRQPGGLFSGGNNANAGVTLGVADEGRRFVHGQDTYSGSAEKYNNATHDTLTSSVHAALGGGGAYDLYSNNSAAHARGVTDDRFVLTGGGIHNGNNNGGQSGSSSRRHSISVAGGPSARRGFQIPGFGFSEALVSPEIESKFPMHGVETRTYSQQQQQHPSSMASLGGYAGGRGRQTGFSDADLLAADLGNKLALDPGSTTTRDSSTASMRDEARLRFDSASVPMNVREWQVSSAPFVPGYGVANSVPRSGTGGGGEMGQSYAAGSNSNGVAYGSFAPPNLNSQHGGINTAYGGNFQPARTGQPGGDYGRPVHPQQLQHQLYSQQPKMSPFAPGQAPSFVGSIGSGPAPGTNQAMNDMGKGVPVQMLNPATRLFIVEFKAGRTDLFFTPDPTVALQVGDLVIVEADRGQDLGKVKEDKITVDDVRAFNVARKQEMDVNVNGAVSARIKGALTNILVGEANAEAGGGPNPNPAVKAVQRELMPKRIFGKAGPADRQLLTAKLQDEAQALALCQQRVKQKRLPMEVLDAEYQWDRRKLTFYFIAEKRIDFRELVRELFRIHKTRIWMASLDHSYLQDDDNKS